MAAVTRLVTLVEVETSFSARHEAVLADGRRVPLLDDRGWSPADIGSLEEIERTARTVVGADEPFGGRSRDEMESNHWAHLAAVLRRQGVTVDAAELALLPHDVVLEPLLLARLGVGAEGDPRIRLATAADAPAFGELLHAFNTEFDEPTPPAAVIAERAAPLVESGEVTVLFAGEGPDGFAELRFRPSLYTGVLDAYLEELYVVPARRGEGLGRALLEAAMRYARDRGAARIDLNTGETDVAARALYESAGFTNREGGTDGPAMLYYERDL